jgi:medium-chain acyl-[acyl-carrier-protein] hydrolase
VTDASNPGHEEVLRWLPTLRNPGPASRFRLVAIPAAGQGAGTMTSWGRQLPSWLQLVAVRLPGREARLAEPRVADMKVVVDALADVVIAGVEAPFGILGHCWGAYVAFELAKELSGRGSTPRFVWLHGQVPPQLNPGLPTDGGDAWNKFVELAQVPADLAENPQIVRTLAPVVQADFDLLNAYLGEQPDHRRLAVQVAVSRGSADPFVRQSDLEAWQALTTAELLVEEVDGGHALEVSTTDLADRVARFSQQFAESSPRG